jgi:hypothetical protein
LKLAAFEQLIVSSLIPWKKLQVKAVHIQVGESQATVREKYITKFMAAANPGG